MLQWIMLQTEMSVLAVTALNKEMLVFLFFLVEAALTIIDS